jgi:phosphoglycerol transferase MdoB-like AlkP superfamily enzyme
MTSLALASASSSTSVLAGFEFSPGEVAGILAFFAAAALLLATYLAAFVAALVHSVQRLHRDGRLRHPVLVVPIPVLALLLAFQTRTTPAAPLFVVAGLGFGYALMWRSGQGWFRWTALPVLPWLVALVGTR